MCIDSFNFTACQWRTGGGGEFGGFKSPPPPEIPKAPQNLPNPNPIGKNLKNSKI